MHVEGGLSFRIDVQVHIGIPTRASMLITYMYVPVHIFYLMPPVHHVK